MEIPKILQTSEEGQSNLALSVKGVLIAVIPVVIALTGLAEADVNAIVDLIIASVNTVSVVAALIATGYGLYRKLRNATA